MKNKNITRLLIDNCTFEKQHLLKLVDLPFKEGIENLPQAIKFPPIQPLGEASGLENLFEKLFKPFEEEASEEEASGASPEYLG